MSGIVKWLRRFVVCAGLVGFCVSVWGQGQGHGQGPVNAADVYRQAALRYKQLDQDKLNDLMDWALANPATPPPAQLRAFLAEAQPVLKMVREASAMSELNWGLDYSKGFGLAIPHLNEMRGLARLMAADSVARITSGDGAGAADHLAAMYRMAGQFNGDGLLISSLVGQAVFSLADGFVQQGVDSAAFSPDQASTMFEVIKSLDANDPFAMRYAIAGERDMIGNWMMNEYGGEGGMEKFQREFLGSGDEAEALGQLAFMNQESFNASIQQTAILMDRVNEVMHLEDAELRKLELAKLEKEAAAGEWGMLTPMVMPAWEKMSETLERAREMVRQRRNMLGAMAEGVVKSEEMQNAASLYLKAIAMMDAMPQASVRMARAASAKPADAVPGEVAALLKESTELVATVREASMISRCEFPRDRFFAGPAVLADYAAGMLELAGVLASDATRLLADGQASEAWDRLAILFRMSFHLARDKSLIGSLAAQRIFELADAIVVLADEHSLLNEEGKKILSGAMTRGLRKDPFGFVAGRLHDRDAVMTWFASQVNRENAVVTAERLTESMRSWTSDDIMLAVAVREALVGPHKFEEAKMMTVVDRLKPVIEPMKHAIVRQQAAFFRAALETADRVKLDDARVERFADVTARAARAHRQFGEALERVGEESEKRKAKNEHEEDVRAGR